MSADGCLAALLRDIDTRLALRSVTIELPAWIDDALQAEAVRRDETISDLLASKLANEAQGIAGDFFDDDFRAPVQNSGGEF